MKSVIVLLILALASCLASAKDVHFVKRVATTSPAGAVKDASKGAKGLVKVSSFPARHPKKFVKGAFRAANKVRKQAL